MDILIADPDAEWSKKLTNFLTEKSHNVSIATSGKDCQLKVFKSNIDAVVLSFELQNHSGLEVLRYLKLNHSKVKVVFVFESQASFSALEIDKDDLRRMGANDIFIKPYEIAALVKSLAGNRQFEEWKKITSSGEQRDEQEVQVRDDEFTRIKIENFLSDNIMIFDHYVKISKNKYIKILHKGDSFDEERLRKYKENQNVEYLYFKTQDRGTYINFINRLLEKQMAHYSMPIDKKVSLTKSITEKYIEEIYVSGLRPELLDEGKKICQNIYQMVQSDKGLADLLKLYEDYDPPAMTHLFLTSLFSVMISKNVEWATARTTEMVGLASLFHDIGKLKLPVGLREKNEDDMTSVELELYQRHPYNGMEMLEKFPSISEPVRQIIYQHHEFSNGSGFPSQLSGVKIYPLAKIVCLANQFSSHLIAKRVTPLEGLKSFLSDPREVARHDALNVKALIAGFMKDKA